MSEPTIVRLEHWLTLRGRTHGDLPAIVAGGRSVTYAELDGEAEATARRLAALGVRAGDRVATTLPAGLDFALLLHAVPRLGAALAPLNTRLGAGELRAQTAAVAPRLVVEGPLEGDEQDVALSRSADPRRPWTVVFTSGTSGAPKPIELTLANHTASAIAAAWGTGVAPDDRWLCALPVFHVGGLAILVRSAVYGTAAELHERFDADSVARALSIGEVTLTSLVPTMLRRLVRAGLDPSPRLRAILLGGAGTPGDLLEWARDRGVRAIRTYGMTETASQVAVADSPGGARLLPAVEAEVSARGEILLRGPMVAAATVAADGWLHSGDRGELDADGLLHVHGRLDDVIVTGGENVSAAEVEEALLSHPGVADASVAGTADPEWGQAVVAWVVAADGVDAEALRAHCRLRVAAYKVPKRVEFVGSLPRSPAGKVLRGQLGSRLSDG